MQGLPGPAACYPKTGQYVPPVKDELSQKTGKYDSGLYDDYPEAVLEDTAEGDRQLAQHTLTVEDLTSPTTSSDDYTAKEASSYQTPIYIPDDLPVPPEVELQESSIPLAGLGVWAQRKIEAGEKFGPYVGEQLSALKNSNLGWEVGMTA
ncbi:MECOM protein, partial [Polypterus senegalus]